MALLELDHVTKRFGRVVIAEDLSFTVDAGETVGIVGPNGAGKTSLFGLISGDLTPGAGQVNFAGRNITRLDPAAREVQLAGDPVGGAPHGVGVGVAAVARDRHVLAETGEDAVEGWKFEVLHGRTVSLARTRAAVRAISFPTIMSPSSTPMPGLASTWVASQAIATCAVTCADRSVSLQVPPQ